MYRLRTLRIIGSKSTGPCVCVVGIRSRWRAIMAMKGMRKWHLTFFLCPVGCLTAPFLSLCV